MSPCSRVLCCLFRGMREAGFLSRRLRSVRGEGCLSLMEGANVDDESKSVLKSETHNRRALSRPRKEECLGADSLGYHTGDG